MELVVASRSAARRGQELIHQLLAFSRRQELRPCSVDLADVIADFQGLLATALGECIALDVVVEADAGPTFLDRAQLESALLNLAVNAKDAMPDGGRLRLELLRRDGDDIPAPESGDAPLDSALVIAVSDTGVGMPEGVRGRACDPFFTTKDVGKGSGLGLSMVQGFVKQSGGRMRIESESGRGTRVELYFPLSSPGTDERKGSGGAQPRAVGARILLVEDEVVLREANRRALEARGHHVTEARNAAEALEILEGDQLLDLMFSGVQLPGGLDGRALARQAQHLRAGLKVLLTSGFREPLEPSDEPDGPGPPSLTKPFSRDQLVTSVESVLAGTD